MARINPNECSRNVFAFLDAIAASEGTSTNSVTKNNGYDVIVGGALFSDFSTHPHVMVDLPKLGIKSSAAGRYQILYRNWIAYKQALELPDFGPISQDKIAIEMIKECHALPFLAVGNFSDAIRVCAHIWASLPGAGYGQHENKMDMLAAVYQGSGGMIA